MKTRVLVAACVLLTGLPWLSRAQTDPSIPLRGIPPRIDNPLDTMLKIKRLQLEQQELERRAAEAKELQREREERTKTVPAPASVQSPVVNSDVSSDLRTGNFFNGRFWNDMSADVKLGYVMGFSDALGSCNDDVLPCLKFAEIQHGLDRFYDEPANILIIVPVAYSLFSEESCGYGPGRF